MTIKVYEVDRSGTTTRLVREEAEVVPLEQPETTFELPPCACLRCTTGSAS